MFEKSQLNVLIFTQFVCLLETAGLIILTHIHNLRTLICIRERPFNLKGGGVMVFFLKKNIPIPNVAEKNILILVEEKKI